MPWGTKVERSESCGEGIAHGAVNGLSNLVGGVTSLVGLRNSGEGLWSWDWDWDWSLDNLGETWAGLGKFVVGAATTGPIGSLVVWQMPGPVGDFLRDSQKTFVGGVAGLVAIDIYAEDPLHNWKDHGWRALGESGFNIATIVVPATKVGNLGKVGRVAEVAMNVTDPLYLATRAAPGLRTMLGPTMESLLRLDRAVDLDLGNVTREIEIPSVNREGINPDLPNTGSLDVDAPPARDYTEPQDRYGSNDGPEQSPAPNPDREPAAVGGRGGESDQTPTTHGGVDSSTDSTPATGGRDGSEAGSQTGDPDADQTAPDGSADSDQSGQQHPDDSTTSPSDDHAPTPQDVGSGSGTADDPRIYGYENPAESLRDAPEPSLDDLDDVGPAKDYPAGSEEHMQARWSEYLDRKAVEGGNPQNWDQWRDTYIRNQGHDPRGRAFEDAFWGDRQFDAENWQRNHDIKHETETGISRNYDIVSVESQTAFELKSGGTVDSHQVAKDARLVRDGWQITYVFGTQPSPGILDRLADLGIDVQVYHSKAVLVP
jgi:hypothetical protein